MFATAISKATGALSTAHSWTTGVAWNRVFKPVGQSINAHRRITAAVATPILGACAYLAYTVNEGNKETQKPGKSKGLGKFTRIDLGDVKDLPEKSGGAAAIAKLHAGIEVQLKEVEPGKFEAKTQKWFSFARQEETTELTLSVRKGFGDTHITPFLNHVLGHTSPADENKHLKSVRNFLKPFNEKFIIDTFSIKAEDVKASLPQSGQFQFLFSGNGMEKLLDTVISDFNKNLVFYAKRSLPEVMKLASSEIVEKNFNKLHQAAGLAPKAKWVKNLTAMRDMRNLLGIDHSFKLPAFVSAVKKANEALNPVSK